MRNLNKYIPTIVMLMMLTLVAYINRKKWLPRYTEQRIVTIECTTILETLRYEGGELRGGTFDHIDIHTNLDSLIEVRKDYRKTH